MKNTIEIEEYDFNNQKYYRIDVNNFLNSVDLNDIENAIIAKNVRYISFNNEQTHYTWKKINIFIKDNDSAIRVVLSSSEMQFEQLSFLEHLIDLEELFIFDFSGTDLSPISHLKKLRILKFIHPFISKKVRLKPLTKLKNIEELEIGHIKDIEEIANFRNLKYICLVGLKTNNLDFLKPLLKIEKIDLRASEKITDYSGLYNLPKLKEAFIQKNYKNVTADFISHLKNLNKLYISDFNALKVFPALENLDKLTDLSIVSCKILNDITGVAKAKKIEKIRLFVGKEFKPSALNVLKEHKCIKEISTGFNTEKENEEAEIIINEILKN